MLITIDDLYRRLQDKCARSKFDIGDMQLVEPGVSKTIVDTAEQRLDIRFPSEFSRLLERFDFSRLSLANLVFEYGHDLEKFIKANLGAPAPWWGTEKRPLNLLLIGTTDGHAIFLSIGGGRILAVEKNSAGEKHETYIAESFEELVRLAGALALGHSRKERIEIASTLHASRFWMQLAMGTA
jgi:hypothetical protein